MEVQDSGGIVMPVSLWVKRLDGNKPTQDVGSEKKDGGRLPSPQKKKSGESRLLCVMEPVERTVGKLQFDGEVRYLFKKIN